MKYVITEISPVDAFYEVRDKYIGRVIELHDVKTWTRYDECMVDMVTFKPEGYSCARGRVTFHAIKLRRATFVDLLLEKLRSKHAPK